MGTTESPSVVIVGSGFGGIGTAIELKRAGFDDFVILERASEVGGGGREKNYPRAACDIPSPLYSFSFEQNPHWPKRYSLQADIHAYLERVVRKYGLTPHLRFGVTVTGATFDEGTAHWRVHTDRGDYEARVFVPAV